MQFSKDVMVYQLLLLIAIIDSGQHYLTQVVHPHRSRLGYLNQWITFHGAQFCTNQTQKLYCHYILQTYSFYLPIAKIISVLEILKFDGSQLSLAFLPRIKLMVKFLANQDQ